MDLGRPVSVAAVARAGPSVPLIEAVVDIVAAEDIGAVIVVETPVADTAAARAFGITTMDTAGRPAHMVFYYWPSVGHVAICHCIKFACRLW